ncbi:MAG: hypothetical protein REI95_00975 [Oxalicibacterium faecigallinarum]|uniref:DUF6566 family protein n=1 Tax=Oxalicibacterium faecigallinarum TaxID=573741 RepID=UPI0028078E52|nr:DUF6566 family protein [Oxalicibacterium faecigallinarum]MDQ7968188.1 hypothetical protein [Oxalicibacterium faecigallinarum]
MSHTNTEEHHGYTVHGTSEKHDTGRWIGSFHIVKNGAPTISISVIQDAFATAEEAASHALYRGKQYIESELV